MMGQLEEAIDEVREMMVALARQQWPPEQQLEAARTLAHLAQALATLIRTVVEIEDPTDDIE